MVAAGTARAEARMGSRRAVRMVKRIFSELLRECSLLSWIDFVCVEVLKSVLLGMWSVVCVYAKFLYGGVFV